MRFRHGQEKGVIQRLGTPLNYSDGSTGVIGRFGNQLQEQGFA
jgi:hypothetical protein